MGSGHFADQPDGSAFGDSPHTAGQWRARMAQGSIRTNSHMFSDINPGPNDILPDAVPTVDITDQAVQRSAIAARRRLMAGSNIDSSFLTGPLGAGPATGSAPTAGGG